MSAASMAKTYDLPPEALRKRLDRQRARDLDCFIEVEDRAANEAQYLYHFGRVRHILEAMRPTTSASDKRPTPKKSF
jgi:hypothetical protein